MLYTKVTTEHETGNYSKQKDERVVKPGSFRWNCWDASCRWAL